MTKDDLLSYVEKGRFEDALCVNLRPTPDQIDRGKAQQRRNLLTNLDNDESRAAIKEALNRAASELAAEQHDHARRARRYAYLAVSLNNENDASRALSYAQKALELDPDNLQTRYALGATLANLARYEEAAPHLELAVKQGYASAAEFLEHIEVNKMVERTLFARSRNYSAIRSCVREAVRTLNRRAAGHFRRTLAASLNSRAVEHANRAAQMIAGENKMRFSKAVFNRLPCANCGDTSCARYYPVKNSTPFHPGEMPDLGEFCAVCHEPATEEGQKQLLAGLQKTFLGEVNNGPVRFFAPFGAELNSVPGKLLASRKTKKELLWQLYWQNRGELPSARQLSPINLFRAPNCSRCGSPVDEQYYRMKTPGGGSATICQSCIWSVRLRIRVLQATPHREALKLVHSALRDLRDAVGVDPGNESVRANLKNVRSLFRASGGNLLGSAFCWLPTRLILLMLDVCVARPGTAQESGTAP